MCVMQRKYGRVCFRNLYDTARGQLQGALFFKAPWTQRQYLEKSLHRTAVFDQFPMQMHESIHQYYLFV